MIHMYPYVLEILTCTFILQPCRLFFVGLVLLTVVLLPVRQSFYLSVCLYLCLTVGQAIRLSVQTFLKYYMVWFQYTLRDSFVGVHAFINQQFNFSSRFVRKVKYKQFSGYDINLTDLNIYRSTQTDNPIAQ